MSTLLQRLRAKEKTDEERRDTRLAKRRVQAANRALRLKAQALQSGTLDLPDNIAAEVEQALELPPPKPVSVPPSEASVDELVTRLDSIKERIFRLQAVFAVSLAQDCAVEANQYLCLFQTIAADLKLKNPEALEKIVAGHESALLSPAIPFKRTVSLDTQRMIELRWESQSGPTRRELPKPRPDGYVADGLQGWV